MGKFGKKKDVDLNPLHYNICLLGESGIGKTTIIKEICEKLVGDEGYIHFDMGREDGAHAIQGIVSETIEDWSKLDEVVTDIIENKTTDYPDLQVVVWDTFDEWITLAEAESIRQSNRKQAQSGGKKATTILEAWGGFGRGQNYAIELILNKISDLKRAGVNSIIVGHVKRTDIVDPVTQETYSKLTADSTQKYFNQIKNKMDFIGLAYIDRDIVREKTGRKDINNRDVMINRISGESRVISFRDNTYSVDSKCRFAEIVSSIPFDSDEFIKAMQDAIMKERQKSGKTVEQSKAEQAERDKAAAESAKAFSEARKASKIDENRNADLVATISAKFSEAAIETKRTIKELVVSSGGEKINEELPTSVLEQILALLQ